MKEVAAIQHDLLDFFHFFIPIVRTVFEAEAGE
jgi:hypothetical protein